MASDLNCCFFTQTTVPGKVFSGSGIWPKYGAGFEKGQNRNLTATLEEGFAKMNGRVVYLFLSTKFQFTILNQRFNQCNFSMYTYFNRNIHDLAQAEY